MTIYINQQMDSYKVISHHIANHIDAINKYIKIEFVYVTAKNSASIKAKGIKQTPTMVANGRAIISMEEIIKYITPPNETKETYGNDPDPDSLTKTYMNGVLDSGDTEDDGEMRKEEIQRKIAAMQKRRPAMDGVGERAIKGGRKVIARNMNREFSNDTDFRQASGVDDVTLTPTSNYVDDMSGDAILEEYRNQEADMHGRKVNNKPIRWSSK